MMLREGWDVQSVTVIVGLAALYAPRRTSCRSRPSGAGLRLMFRDADLATSSAST